MATNRCMLILISGGPASGKKLVQSALRDSLLSLPSTPPLTVETLHQADFLYTSTSNNSKQQTDPERLDAYDLDALTTLVARVRGGDTELETPTVDMVTMVALEKRRLEERPDVLIVEGTYVLAHAALDAMADVKIFVDCDADVRLARRVVRDLEQRNIPLESIFDQHVRFSKSAYSQIILPTKQIADIILPGGGKGVNVAGVELIAQSVLDELSGGSSSARGGRSMGAGLGGILAEGDLTTGGLPSYYETV